MTAFLSSVFRLSSKWIATLLANDYVAIVSSYEKIGPASRAPRPPSTNNMVPFM